MKFKAHDGTMRAEFLGKTVKIVKQYPWGSWAVYMDGELVDEWDNDSAARQHAIALGAMNIIWMEEDS